MKNRLQLFLALLLGCWTTSGALAAAPDLSQNTAEERDFADKYLDRWGWEQGRKSQLRLIKSVVIDGTLEVSSTPGVNVKFHSEQTADGSFRHEIQRPDVGLVIEAYDGKIAWWQNDVLGFGLIPPSYLSDLIRWDDIRAALLVKDAYPKRRALPDQTMEGLRCNVLALKPGDGEPETWYFSDQSGLWAATVRQPAGDDPGGAIRLSDYATVGSFKFPFRIVHYFPGGSNVTRREKIVLDQPLDRSRFSPPEKLVREAEEIDRVLEQNLTAIGGRDATNRIHTRVTKQSVTVLTSGLHYETMISQKLPNLVLETQEMPGMGHIMEGFDGRTGWSRNEIQGYRELKGAELAQLVGSASLNAAAYLQPSYPLRRLVGERDVNGRPAKAIVLGTFSNLVGTYYFDEGTSRLVRVESNLIAGPKSALGVTIDFSDFRSVDGVLLPFTTSVVNPAIHSVTTILSLQNNVPLDDAIFKPAREE